METSADKTKKKRPRVPAELSVTCTYNNQQITMWTEYVWAEGMMLFSQEYVRPRAVFEALIWITPLARPLRVFLSVGLVERTSTGYGISATFSGISAEDRQRWESAVESAMASAGRQLGSELRAQPPVKRRLLVVENALPQTALAAMEQRGLSVRCVSSTEEVLDALRSGEVDLVLCDLAGSAVNGLELCRRIAEQPSRPGVILLTSRGTPEDFLQGIYAGALRVIAKPCSHEILIAQITRELIPQSVRLSIPVVAERAAGAATQRARSADPPRRPSALVA